MNRESISNFSKRSEYFVKRLKEIEKYIEKIHSENIDDKDTRAKILESNDQDAIHKMFTKDLVFFKAKINALEEKITINEEAQDICKKTGIEEAENKVAKKLKEEGIELKKHLKRDLISLKICSGKLEQAMLEREYKKELEK